VTGRVGPRTVVPVVVVSFEDARAAADIVSLAVDETRWVTFVQRVVGTVLADLFSEAPMGVSVTLVDAQEIAVLKQEHLGGDGEATDVLAFPLDEVPPPGTPAPADSEPPLLLGDIVLCPSVAAAQATTHAGAFPDELALLLVHAVLHLVGHDHAEPHEANTMRGQERRLLDALYGPLVGDPWCEPADPHVRSSS